MAQTTTFAPSAQRTGHGYVTPRLVLIGDAASVILGVAGGGEDFLGYSRPEFEFEIDGPADLATTTLDVAAATPNE